MPIFKDYDSAYKYLVRCREDYFSETSNAENIFFFITRERFYKGDENDDIYEYRFNSNLEITDVSYTCTLNQSEYSLSDFFITVPHPFKTGNLVKVIYGYEENDVYYGVLGGLKEETENMHRGIGDYTDMELFIDIVYEKNGKMCYGHQHAVITQLEKCLEFDIPPKEREMLVLMSDAIKGKIGSEELLLSIEKI